MKKMMLLPFILLSMISCDMDFNKKKKEEKKEAVVEAIPIEVEPLGFQTIEAIVRATANLEAEAEVKVISRAGNPVIELLVEEGDFVEKDQTLAVLENRQQTIGVQKAKSQLEKEAKDFQRSKELFDQELITPQDHNNAAYEYKQAQLQLSEAEQQLEWTIIRAPISGVITKRLVKLGDQVSAGMHLFDLIDFNSIVARIYLPEKVLGQLETGLPARLQSEALPNKIFIGSILRIAPTVDAGTGTVKVTVKVDELGALKPGMFVEVSLIIDTHEQALVIPKKALVYDGDRMFVFRVNQEDETQVNRMEVTPILMDKNYVEVASPFAKGDEVVIAGQTGLKEGSLVRKLNVATNTDNKTMQVGN